MYVKSDISLGIYKIHVNSKPLSYNLSPEISHWTDFKANLSWNRFDFRQKKTSSMDNFIVNRCNASMA